MPVYWRPHTGDILFPNGNSARVEPFINKGGSFLTKPLKRVFTPGHFRKSAYIPNMLTDATELLYPYPKRRYRGYLAAMAHLLGVTEANITTWIDSERESSTRRSVEHLPQLPADRADVLADYLLHHGNRALEMAANLRDYAERKRDQHARLSLRQKAGLARYYAERSGGVPRRHRLPGRDDIGF